MTAETKNSTCHEAFVYAFSALEEWPRGFEEFMEKYGLSIAGRPPEFGAILQFHRRCRKGTLDFITIAIEEFIENASSPYADVLCQTQTLHKRFIPATELTMYSIAGPRHLEWLLRSGRVRVYRKARNGSDEVLIDLDSVVRYKEKLALCFTSIDAAKSLGISVDDVTALVWHGCLTPVSGASVDGLSEWRFDCDETERLLGKVGANVLVETDGEGGEFVFGGDVLSLLRRNKISVGRFVRNVVDGKPVPRLKSEGNGLTRFAFSKKEIDEYISAQTAVKIGAEETSTPNFRQLARTLEKLMERNKGAYLRGLSCQDKIADCNWVSVKDLANIAISVFSRPELELKKEGRHHPSDE